MSCRPAPGAGRRPLDWTKSRGVLSLWHNRQTEKGDPGNRSAPTIGRARRAHRGRDDHGPGRPRPAEPRPGAGGAGDRTGPAPTPAAPTPPAEPPPAQPAPAQPALDPAQPAPGRPGTHTRRRRATEGPGGHRTSAKLRTPRPGSARAPRLNRALPRPIATPAFLRLDELRSTRKRRPAPSSTSMLLAAAALLTLVLASGSFVSVLARLMPPTAVLLVMLAAARPSSAALLRMGRVLTGADNCKDGSELQ